LTTAASSSTRDTDREARGGARLTRAARAAAVARYRVKRAYRGARAGFRYPKLKVNVDARQRVGGRFVGAQPAAAEATSPPAMGAGGAPMAPPPDSRNFCYSRAFVTHGLND
jgi:hypothetical protein